MPDTLLNHPYARTIWNKLQSVIKNEYGTAGLMGNLQAESGLYPDRVQGDIPYSDYSVMYTSDVDNGIISEYEFVHNGPNGGGYGLAQWTYYTRKQALYDRWKEDGYSSIGSVDLACAHLIHELVVDFPGVMSVLQNATSIAEASNKVLHDFEAPADQSESVENQRAAMGINVYNAFASGTDDPDPDDPDEPDNPTTPTKKHKQLSKLLLFAAASDYL